MTTPATQVRTAYLLGHSSAEQRRLMRQAKLLESITESRLRDAGIGAGQHVLDVGCGPGDVSMIAARLVGVSGHVVSIDRDASAIALARERAAAEDLRNLTFVQEDLQHFSVEGSFDAVVGRLVLKHLPDATAVLHGLRRLLRPGATVLFQEGSWAPMLAIGSRLPLWSQLLSTLREIFIRSGLNPDAGLDLHCAFEDAGLGRPAMRMDIPLADDPTIADIEIDLLQTLLPVAREYNVSLTDLGDLNTLADRIHAERVEHRAVVGFLAIVTAWSKVTVEAHPRRYSPR